MTIKEFIAELQKYPNQDAEINIITNVIDENNDAFDKEECEVSFFRQDVSDANVYDICVYKSRLLKEPQLHKLLQDNKKLTIELDMNDPHANIVITNPNNEVLREIQVGGRHEQNENICIVLSNLI